eukprot:SAG31_NODE_45224_length_259_cov_1.293750_1_plen_70_part_10
MYLYVLVLNFSIVRGGGRARRGAALSCCVCHTIYDRYSTFHRRRRGSRTYDIGSKFIKFKFIIVARNPIG